LLLNGKDWHKPAAQLGLKSLPLAGSVAKCYMKELESCVGPISGEHLISESVIHVLKAEGDFSISGLPWLALARKGYWGRKAFARIAFAPNTTARFIFSMMQLSIFSHRYDLIWRAIRDRDMRLFRGTISSDGCLRLPKQRPCQRTLRGEGSGSPARFLAIRQYWKCSTIPSSGRTRPGFTVR
jgi:hypothetical protein